MTVRTLMAGLLTGILAAAALGAPVPALAAPVGLAVPATLPAPLPGSDASGLVLDRFHQHLLIAGDGVLVDNLDGSTVGTVLPGVSIDAIALSTDGDSLWAVASATHQLYQVDLGTLAVSRTASLPAQVTTLESVVPVSERFVVVNGYSSWVVFDTTTGVFRAGGRATALRAIPGTTRVLALGAPDAADIYDVGSGHAVLVRSASSLAGCAVPEAFAVAPDGRSATVTCDDASAGPDVPLAYDLQQYRLWDFNLQTSYPDIPAETDGYLAPPNGMVYSPDGSFLAITERALYGPDVVLFHRAAGSWTLVSATDFGPVTAATPDSVQFSEDGTEVYAVSFEGGTKFPDLTALNAVPAAPSPLALPASTLTLASPAHTFVGDPVVVSGTLRLADLPPAGAAGRQVTLSRTANGATVSVQRTTDATGAFRWTNTPWGAGTARYTVSYDGDPVHSESFAGALTRVAKHPTQLTLTWTGNLDNATITVTAHLGPTWTNRAVTILEAGVPIASGNVDAAGDLTTQIPWPCVSSEPYSCLTTLVATFAGDARWSPATAENDLH